MTASRSTLTPTLPDLVSRPSDAPIMREAAREPYRRLDIRPGDVVLDIGAHIGTFTRYALRCGARHVVAVEAHPESARLLELNTRGCPVTVIARAVTEAPLYWYRNPSCVVTEAGRRRRELDVERVTTAELLRYWPDVVKVDCEGSEWNLLQETTFPFARELAVEFHFVPGGADLKLQRHVYELLRSDGWELVAGSGTLRATPSWPAVTFWRRR